jgi:CBS domain-containing protein
MLHFTRPANGNARPSDAAPDLAARLANFRRAVDLSGIIADAVTISPHGNLKGAANLMRRRRVTALAVLWDKKVIGLITEGDIVEALAAHNETAGFIRVDEAMRQPVPAISPDGAIEHAVRLMIRENCHHLPVIDNGNLMGMVNLGDLLNRRPP